MPRTLPWLVEAAKKKGSNQTASSFSPAPKRKRFDNLDDIVDSDLNPIGTASPARRQKAQPNRTPSTSPPPAPPEVEYMREGYRADDRFMMVEDEFHSTAKMFTQHIHHAEYVRLKRLARSRGAGTLQAISRPTDGRTEQSVGLRLELQAEEKDRKMGLGLKRMSAEVDSSEEEDEFMRDPQLAGLMTGEQGVSMDLSGIAKSRSNTRAAAGFSQSPRNVERKKDALAEDDMLTFAGTSSHVRDASRGDVYPDDESDDLDTPHPKPIKPKEAGNPSRMIKGDSGRQRESGQTRPESSTSFKRFARAPKADHVEDTRTSVTDPVAFKHKHKSGLSDKKATSPRILANDFTRRNPQSSATTDYLAKRRADKERRAREEKRKAQRADDIPTFIL